MFAVINSRCGCRACGLTRRDLCKPAVNPKTVDAEKTVIKKPIHTQARSQKF